MRALAWFDEMPFMETDGNTLSYYFPFIKTGVGQSENKSRPKRKPRPKKSARGGKK